MHRKKVVFMSRTIKILISNWPPTRKTFSVKTSCFWLFKLYVQFLCSDWSNLIGEFMRKIYAASGNLFTDSCSWQSFLSSCGVFNFLFPLDVQDEIQPLSRFFSHSLFIGIRVEKCAACQSHRFGWHRFRFSPWMMHKRVEKSRAILALLDGFQELHLEW